MDYRLSPQSHPKTVSLVHLTNHYATLCSELHLLYALATIVPGLFCLVGILLKVTLEELHRTGYGPYLADVALYGCVAMGFLWMVVVFRDIKPKAIEKAKLVEQIRSFGHGGNVRAKIDFAWAEDESFWNGYLSLGVFASLVTALSGGALEGQMALAAEISGVVMVLLFFWLGAGEPTAFDMKPILKDQPGIKNK